MSVDEIDRALEALEKEGARAFDAPACDCARTLYVRAEELGGSVGERLLARAAAHVEALRERFCAQRARVDRALEELAAQAGEQPALAQALHKGELARVARSVRRMRRQPRVRTPRPARRTPASESPFSQLDCESDAVADISASETATQAQLEGVDPVRARRHRMATYEDSVAELVASYALARATDVVPEGAGPYNALRIASGALDTMRALSPGYLTVQLNRLEELASLLALPELPEKPEPARPLPKKRGRALKG